jgi:hypothetical protein
MLSDSSKQLPMFSGVAGTKHMPVWCAQEKRARAAGNRREGLNVSPRRADLPPSLGMGRKWKNEQEP